VNDLSDNYVFSDEFLANSKRYFLQGNQTTGIALENGKVVACATMAYIELMPTFSHPTGNRAHLMNVYTNASYRRQGVARKLVQMLIDEAKEKGVTEISLDATDLGRPLYEALGFCASDECMVMNLMG
ncbi:MAG: GNAT family N-acetyltransferase, partial [bacterium]|nr:GNAT family N-acetyltransferase [bacterium]